MRNKVVFIIDLVLVIAASLLIAIILMKVKNEWTIIIIVFFVYIAANMHVIFNSKAGNCIVTMMKGSCKNGKKS